jgi:hypothetical protein
MLTASGTIGHGRRIVLLNWTGATGANVDIYGNNALLVNTQNDGGYTDTINGAGHGTLRIEFAKQALKRVQITRQ